MDENKLALNFETDFLDDDAIFMPREKKEVPSVLPDQTDDIVVRQYLAGATLKQITKDHGLSYGKVYEIINRKGVKLRHGRYSDSKSGKRLTTMSQLQKSGIIQDYLCDEEVKVIMERYNLNKHALYSILDEAQIPRRQKKQFISLDIAAIRDAETVSVVPQEPDTYAWQYENTLKIVVKKSAFREGTTQITGSYNLITGKVEFFTEGN